MFHPIRQAIWRLGPIRSDLLIALRAMSRRKRPTVISPTVLSSLALLENLAIRMIGFRLEPRSKRNRKRIVRRGVSAGKDAGYQAIRASILVATQRFEMPDLRPTSTTRERCKNTAFCQPIRRQTFRLTFARSMRRIQDRLGARPMPPRRLVMNPGRRCPGGSGRV